MSHLALGAMAISMERCIDHRSGLWRICSWTVRRHGWPQDSSLHRRHAISRFIHRPGMRARSTCALRVEAPLGLVHWTLNNHPTALRDGERTGQPTEHRVVAYQRYYRPWILLLFVDWIWRLPHLWRLVFPDGLRHDLRHACNLPCWVALLSRKPGVVHEEGP